MNIKPPAQTVQKNRMETEIEEDDNELDDEVGLLICESVNVGFDVLKHTARQGRDL